MSEINLDDNDGDDDVMPVFSPTILIHEMRNYRGLRLSNPCRQGYTITAYNYHKPCSKHMFIINK